LLPWRVAIVDLKSQGYANQSEPDEARVADSDSGGGGNAPLAFRCCRILSMTNRSSLLALGIILASPPHFEQIDTLILNTRLRRCAFMPSGAGHGLMALFGCFVFIFFPGMSSASFGRRHIDTVSANWSKYSVEPCQVQSRLGHQGSQLADEIQRIEGGLGRGVTIRRFKLVADIA
jgi:hypothetical protein